MAGWGGVLNMQGCEGLTRVNAKIRPAGLICFAPGQRGFCMLKYCCLRLFPLAQSDNMRNPEATRLEAPPTVDLPCFHPTLGGRVLLLLPCERRCTDQNKRTKLLSDRRQLQAGLICFCGLPPLCR